MLIHLGVKEQTVFTSYAKFTLHDFSPDFNSLTGFAKLLTNARNQRLVHASDNHAVWIIKDAIWENRPLNIWHAKYLDLPAIQNPAVWNEFWLKNTSPMTYSRWESMIQGSGKFGEELYEISHLACPSCCTQLLLLFNITYVNVPGYWKVIIDLIG